MAQSFSIEVDRRLARYLERLQKSRRLSPGEAGAELMKVGYYDVVRCFHRQYLNGEITLRRMAQELGLEYRDMYALLEELKLPMA
jgi:hypothetical protein